MIVEEADIIVVLLNTLMNSVMNMTPMKRNTRTETSILHLLLCWGEVLTLQNWV